MNAKSSVFRNIAGAVVAAAAGLAFDAQADFTHYSTVRTESGGLVKYELYANFDGPNDTALNAFQISLVSGSMQFHHTDALSGGVDSTLAGTWNPQFVLVPGAMDSYVCIGGGEGIRSGNSTAADPDWGASGFNTAQMPYGDGELSGAGWFNQSPPNLQGRVNAQGQVKLGQFVISLAVDATQTVVRLKLGYDTGVPDGSVQYADSIFAIGCGLDCDSNGISDCSEIENGLAADCDSNGILDTCDLASGLATDCDSNGILDSCDLVSGSATDCNNNGLHDSCDLLGGGADCNANGVLDECELASGSSTDLDGNGVLDDCPGEYIVGGSGFDSIQQAINAAPDGSTVLVSPGNYGPLELSGRALTLRSLAGAAVTAVDGGGTARCFTMQVAGSGVTLIDGFTFRKGFADCGAAVRVTLSAPVFVDCIFSDNAATVHGGAIALHGAAARFVGCDFVANATDGMGGAVFLEGEASTGTSVFENCLFEQNTAGSIGGAIVSSGLLSLVDCVVERNTSGISGGGATFMSQGSASVGGTRFCLNAVGNVQGQFSDLGGNILSQDCDGDGLCDYDEIADGSEIDCNGNGLPDACDIASGGLDCNENGVLDACDLASGASQDIDGNGVPDDCKPDCDGDGLPDAWELANGFDLDCDANGVPDFCQISASADLDDDQDGRIDACELARGDFNLDGAVNGADLTLLLSLWGATNPPVGDLDGDNIVTAADLAILLGNWGTVVWDPVLSTIEPRQGSEGGGMAVTLRGAGFEGVSGVFFDGVAAASFTIVNGTTIIAITPAHDPGLVQVEIEAGAADALVPALFEYLPLGVPHWSTLIAAAPDPTVVYDASLRSAILATGLAWKVRDIRTGIEMMLIPPGTYEMGCAAPTSTGCPSDESPVHSVTISQAFYMGRTEVTQSQWVEIMGSNPSFFQGDMFPDSSDYPVEQVSWETVHSFLAAVEMRLPTEAEWEYACRAGTTTVYHGWAGQPTGTNDDSLVGEVAWCLSNAGSQTRPVGTRAANGFGLHDMLGNVFEPVIDWYSPSYYSISPVVDPQGPSSGAYRVWRGAAWDAIPLFLRCSDRFFDSPSAADRWSGFRVVRNP